MEKNKYSKLIYGGILAFFLASSVGLNGERKFQEEYSFWGTVLEVNAEEQLFKVRIDEGVNVFDEKEIEVGVSMGDVEVGYLGRTIKGKLRVDQDPMLLHSIWPWDKEKESRAKDINAILHYDTLMKPGTKAEKRVGEKMPEFALWTQDAQLITHEDLKGYVVVVNFIYTRCTKADMCPAATRFMADLQKRTKQRGLDGVVFLTITFDPINDTPGVLKHYSKSYDIDNGNYLFLTGDPNAVSDLMRQFGIYAVSRKGDVNHTMRTAIINKDGYIIYAESDMTWSVENFFKKIGSLL